MTRVINVVLHPLSFGFRPGKCYDLILKILLVRKLNLQDDAVFKNT